MKLATFGTNGTSRLALYVGGRWLDLTGITTGKSDRPVTDVRDFISSGLCSPSALSDLITETGSPGRLDEFVLSAPPRFTLPFRPGKIIAVGRNYLAHAQETGHDAPSEPIIFAKSPEACIGPGESIVVKKEYGRVDHEAELALVIGKKAVNVHPSETQDYIAGYTLLNDVTARDMQKQAIENRHPWFLSKSFDTFCPLGPVVALPDEIEWPVQIDIECKVNGEVRQKSNTSLFIFKIPTLLAYITRYITLMPGDVIATGTPEGISPIRTGDVVEISSPQLGVLRNPVIGG